MKILKVYLFIDICFTMQKYFLFLIFRCFISFFFNNFAVKSKKG